MKSRHENQGVPQDRDLVGGHAAGADRDMLHDELLHKLKEHMPDGPGPSRKADRRTIRLLVPLAVIGIVGGVVALHCLGGWAAVGIGAVLVAIYYFFGWGPEVVAAFLRRREHQRLEETVEAEIEDMESHDRERTKDRDSN